MSESYVLTPGGFRARSLVHYIEREHHLDQTGGRIRKIHRSGRVVLDYGTIEAKPPHLALMPGNVNKARVLPGAAVPDLGSGWIAYTNWSNTTGKPVSKFATSWVVPAEPTTRSGQTVFLFNGIQNSTMIFQPVLQWGPSAAGGGEYWAIASWYADGQDGHSFYSSLTRVNVGDSLVGVMELTGQSAAGFSYRSWFDGQDDTNLPIQNVPELTWCIETLEAYGIRSASDYPASPKTSLTSIELLTGADQAPLRWALVNKVTDVGQHCVLVQDGTPGGQVDICYR